MGPIDGTVFDNRSPVEPGTIPLLFIAWERLGLGLRSNGIDLPDVHAHSTRSNQNVSRLGSVAVRSAAACHFRRGSKCGADRSRTE